MLQRLQSCEACILPLDMNFSWQDYIPNRWNNGPQWTTTFLECGLCLCEENDWRDEQMLQRGIRMQLYIYHPHKHLRSSWQFQVSIDFFKMPLFWYRTSARWFLTVCCVLLPLVSMMATSFQALSTRLTWPKRTVREDNSSFVYLCCTQHFLSFTLTTMQHLVNHQVFCLLLMFVHASHKMISIEHFNV